ncbi:Uncharacterised protein [uncultured archaeon]|nr:Uncharacterised protein [uncultured archaeon]
MEELEILKIGFVEAFLVIFTAIAAFMLIILIGQILFMIHKADKDLSNTDLFLDKAVLERTWIYISVAGAGFALNILIKFMIWLSIAGDLLKTYYFAEITQVVFLIAFIMAVYNKMQIIKSQIYAEEGTKIWRRLIKNG